MFVQTKQRSILEKDPKLSELDSFPELPEIETAEIYIGATVCTVCTASMLSTNMLKSTTTILQ